MNCDVMTVSIVVRKSMKEKRLKHFAQVAFEWGDLDNESAGGESFFPFLFTSKLLFAVWDKLWPLSSQARCSSHS